MNDVRLCCIEPCERFWQPFVERLLHFAGLKYTLCYLSTSKLYFKERKWLIETLAWVEHGHAAHFCAGVCPKQTFCVVRRRRQMSLAAGVKGLWLKCPRRITSAFPDTLTHLDLGDNRVSLQQCLLPAGLTHLALGFFFNEPLDTVVLPKRLQHLRFGTMFNQPLHNVCFPETLLYLCFGARFNQPLDAVTLPCRLQVVAFGLHFAQSLDRVVWPHSLQKLQVPNSVYLRLPNTLPAHVRVKVTNTYCIDIDPWCPKFS